MWIHFISYMTLHPMDMKHSCLNFPPIFFLSKTLSRLFVLEPWEIYFMSICLINWVAGLLVSLFKSDHLIKAGGNTFTKGFGDMTDPHFLLNEEHICRCLFSVKSHTTGVNVEWQLETWGWNQINMRLNNLFIIFMMSDLWKIS